MLNFSVLIIISSMFGRVKRFVRYTGMKKGPPIPGDWASSSGAMTWIDGAAISISGAAASIAGATAWISSAAAWISGAGTSISGAAAWISSAAAWITGAETRIAGATAWIAGAENGKQGKIPYRIIFGEEA